MKKTIAAKAKRMQDQELVLRFLSFYTMDYKKSKKNITVFLDEMMKKLETMRPGEREELAEAFRSAIKRSWDIFGETAFEKITDNGSGIRRNLKNSTLFEVWTVALARLSEEDMKILQEKKDILQQKHIKLISEDEMYFQSITFSTQKKSFYQIRCEKVQTLIKEVLYA